MALARGSALDAYGERIRLQALPAISELAWGDRDTWRRLRGARTDADSIPEFGPPK